VDCGLGSLAGLLRSEDASFLNSPSGFRAHQ
jgi:hypothetical protein